MKVPTSPTNCFLQQVECAPWYCEFSREKRTNTTVKVRYSTPWYNRHSLLWTNFGDWLLLNYSPTTRLAQRTYNPTYFSIWIGTHALNGVWTLYCHGNSTCNCLLFIAIFCLASTQYVIGITSTLLLV